MAACSSPHQYIHCPVCATGYPGSPRIFGSPTQDLYQICDRCFNALGQEQQYSPLKGRNIAPVAARDAREELIYQANENGKAFLDTGLNALSTVQMEVLWTDNKTLCLKVLEKAYKEIETLLNTLPILIENINWKEYEYENLQKLLKVGGCLEAADHGNPYAQYCLATCYATGLMLGIPDWWEAIRYYTLAIKNGMSLAMADLGWQLLNGEKIEKKEELGIQYLQRALDRDSPKAGYLLGKCYLEGRGVNINPQVGFKHLKRAAEQGFSLAYFDLANCYAGGIGVTKQIRLARKYYEKAIMSGDPRGKDSIETLNAREAETKDCLLL